MQTNAEGDMHAGVGSGRAGHAFRQAPATAQDPVKYRPAAAAAGGARGLRAAISHCAPKHVSDMPGAQAAHACKMHVRKYTYAQGADASPVRSAMTRLAASPQGSWQDH